MPATHEFKLTMKIRGNGSSTPSDETQSIKNWFASDGVMEAWGFALEYVETQLPKSPDQEVYDVEQSIYRARHLNPGPLVNALSSDYQPRHLWATDPLGQPQATWANRADLLSRSLFPHP